MRDNKAWGFLEHTLAHSDEDAPRLVFADWLEEQGNDARIALPVGCSGVTT
jgi:uncharacterized protein (TIGR02996 family)